MLIGEIIARMRHDGCGGRAGTVELLTEIEGVSTRPVRRTELIAFGGRTKKGPARVRPSPSGPRLGKECQSPVQYAIPARVTIDWWAPTAAEARAPWL